MKYSVFHIEGGIGKHIVATAVAEAIKNNHPDRELIVVCAWPEIFITLNYVHKVYKIGNTPYFYQTYIQNADSLIFHNNPYFTTDHIYKRKTLVETWCDLYAIKYNNEQPKFGINQLQNELYANSWVREKPVMVIHTNGGLMTTNAKAYSWTRDMPVEIAQALVEHYKSKFHIIQVTKINSPKIEGAEHIFATAEKAIDTMHLLSLAWFSEKRILIDSCLQHAAAAVGKKSTVLWNGTSPKVFGYDLHDNICSEIPENIKLPDSYLFDFDFDGKEYEYPFTTNTKMFDIDAIIKSVG